MRSTLLAFLLFSLALEEANAQQLSLYSQYLHNGFVLNPGMTGWDDRMAVHATYRHQWTNMPGAPKTGTAAFTDYEPYYKMGFGGYFLFDDAGPITTIGLTGLYSYHIDLSSWTKNRHLSIGASLSLSQYRLRGDELILYHQVDPLVFDNTGTRLSPDAGIGIFYYEDRFYAGFSVPQLLSLNVRINGDGGLSNLQRIPHLYGVVGTKAYLSNKRDYFEPSLWLKYAPTAPPHALLNLRFKWDDSFMIGAGYQTDNSLILEAGFDYRNRFQIGYAFSRQFSTLSGQLGTSHELILSYTLRENDTSW
jgi:type IX secretion system PorP/SprF family membrane protein